MYRIISRTYGIMVEFRGQIDDRIIKPMSIYFNRCVNLPESLVVILC